MNILQAVKEKLPIRVCSYSASSASAKALAEYLSKKIGTPVRVRARDPLTRRSFIISWGGHKVPHSQDSVVLNTTSAVCRATNKWNTFNDLRRADVPIPDFTNERDAAGEWLANGDTVVARHVLTSHSGRGIQIVRGDTNVYRDPAMPDAQPWYAARLFTKYVKRAEEYRVFATRTGVILVYRKGLVRDIPEESRQFLVRTHATGWNFCAVQLSDVPQEVLDVAVRSVCALGLHFGAVDIGWNQHHRTASVFEVNTAPGIQGSTVQAVGDALCEVDHALTATAPEAPRTTTMQATLDALRHVSAGIPIPVLAAGQSDLALVPVDIRIR